MGHIKGCMMNMCMSVRPLTIFQHKSLYHLKVVIPILR